MLTLDRICFEDLFKFWSRWFFNGIPMFSEFVEHHVTTNSLFKNKYSYTVFPCVYTYIAQYVL
jgi:hypothetical protein